MCHFVIRLLIISAFKIFVTTGAAKDSRNNRLSKTPTRTSEMLFIFKRKKKISSSFSKLTAGYPKNEAEGAFGGLCKGKIIIGHGKHVFEYQVKENKTENVLKSENGQFLIIEYLAPRRSCRVNIKVLAFANGK